MEEPETLLLDATAVLREHLARPGTTAGHVLDALMQALLDPRYAVVFVAFDVPTRMPVADAVRPAAAPAGAPKMHPMDRRLYVGTDPVGAGSPHDDAYADDAWRLRQFLGYQLTEQWPRGDTKRRAVLLNVPWINDDKWLLGLYDNMRNTHKPEHINDPAFAAATFVEDYLTRFAICDIELSAAKPEFTARKTFITGDPLLRLLHVHVPTPDVTLSTDDPLADMKWKVAPAAAVFDPLALLLVAAGAVPHLAVNQPPLASRAALERALANAHRVHPRPLFAGAAGPVMPNGAVHLVWCAALLVMAQLERFDGLDVLALPLPLPLARVQRAQWLLASWRGVDGLPVLSETNNGWGWTWHKDRLLGTQWRAGVRTRETDRAVLPPALEQDRLTRTAFEILWKE